MNPLVLISLSVLPPTVNHYYLNRKTTIKRGPKAGKSYVGRMLSEEAHAFRSEVLRASRAGHSGAARLRGRLALGVLAQPPTGGAWDLDNRLKPLQDALTWAGVIEDDALFDLVAIGRGKIRAGGGCAIAISRFDPEESFSILARLGIAFEVDLAGAVA